MAYLTVTTSCLDELHDGCPGTENTPPPDSEVCGGGLCVCLCHGTLRGDSPLYQAVREQVLAAREKDDG